MHTALHRKTLTRRKLAAIYAYFYFCCRQMKRQTTNSDPLHYIRHRRRPAKTVVASVSTWLHTQAAR